MKKALYKVPNGKLLKIFLDDSENKIARITITGDFFLYPEENLEKLEEALNGSLLQENELKAAIMTFFDKHPTTLFGIDIDSLVSTIINASHSI